MQYLMTTMTTVIVYNVNIPQLPLQLIHISVILFSFPFFSLFLLSLYFEALQY